MRYVYVSIATTGMDEEIDDIIKVTLIVEENSLILDRMNFNIRPRKGRLPSTINTRALEFNGVTLEQLRKFDDPEEACYRLIYVLKKYSDNGSNKLTPVGHNLKFDYKFLDSYVERYTGYSYLNYVNPKGVDIMYISHFVEFCRNIKFYNSRLATLAKHFRLNYDPKDINTKLDCIRTINYSFKKLITGEAGILTD